MLISVFLLASKNIRDDTISLSGNDIAPLSIYNTIEIDDNSYEFLPRNLSYYPKKGKCPSMNTELDDTTNLCVCKKGYKADSIESDGCYRCLEECFENSYCTYPGKCVCIPGYVGSSCLIKIPIIKIITPRTCQRGKQCSLNVTVTNNEGGYEIVYCHFKDIIIKSNKLNDQIYECVAPVFKTDGILISLSFNALNVSHEIFQIDYVDVPTINIFKVIIYLIVVVLVLVSLTRVYSFISRRKNYEEVIPFQQTKPT
ncbi:MGC84085 protein, putative [Trichomonas vaginalis G3]|uniref:MGC84085 protein, putative n=1 Tax=Trichomonas vaginalis (strain ATCC PRA-98 / G3) TaxID=412133 RepID=A2E9F0_TRIV3|nr:laminin domain-containing protein [Trichomonas vaginalis G3]EAY10714.1 MGC84085 protein, putative [Trichomonas vaginalis G3]KAI5538607.1 laminin domain-containing protein [Trichomonas vaginalis G3]|eukprot:XP_001322937.1 MGC84085 protein [Trichomonas vaginalis G3]